MPIHPVLRSLLLTLPMTLNALQAEAPKYPDYWNDPALSAKIDQDIDRNRKSDAVIQVINAKGKPLSGVRVTIEQIDSSFHFGANIFMIDGYQTQEQNRRYEAAFCNLFNAATVPFYWNDLEPEQGKPRFAADSAFIARRPPPERVVAFCQERGLKMHGHPLVWNHKKWFVPEWLPTDTSKSIPLFEDRIQQIAKRYGTRIHRWDTVNEVIAGPNLVPGIPQNYERLAYSWAERYFPVKTRLDINETTSAWTVNRQAYTTLIQRLRNDHARIGGIGLQFHLFHEDSLAKVVAGNLHTPGALMETLDHYGQFGLPIHISEITLACPTNDEAGQALQAQVARSLYRLWFSHPAVDSITWWNLADGGAAQGEEKLLSGLLTSDLQPKAAYNALHVLLHKEWRTQAQGRTNAEGNLAIRGFHGRYKVRLNGEELTKFFTIQSGTSNKLTIQVHQVGPDTSK